MRQERASKSDIETPAGDCIQHADLAGKLERVVEDREHRTGHQPSALGALRGSAQKYDRIGAIASVGLKIVLDSTDMGESQFVRFIGNIQTVAEVIPRRLLLRRHIREKLNAELHGTLADLRSAVAAEAVTGIEVTMRDRLPT